MDDGFEAHLHTHHSVRMHSDVKLRRELVSGDFNQRIMKLAVKREQSDVEGATGVNMEYYGDAKIPLACDGFMSDENLAFASASASSVKVDENVSKFRSNSYYYPCIRSKVVLCVLLHQSEGLRI